MRSQFLVLAIILGILGLSGISYAIDVSSCQAISSPGSYQLTTSLSGAPLNVGGRPTCIHINSDDVTFECSTYTLSNNGTSGTAGIYVSSQDNVTIKNCVSGISSYEHGVYGYYSSNLTIQTVVVRNSSDGSIALINSDDVNITNSILRDNKYGLYSLGSGNVNISGTTFYNNLLGGGMNYDIRFISSSGDSLYLDEVTLRNPSGTTENQSKLSASYTSDASEDFGIIWASNPSGFPTNRTTFANKYTEFENLTAGVNFSDITYHWDQSEVTVDDNESTFELWKHEGSWADTSATLDTSGNTLTLSDHVIGSTYAIFQEYTPPPVTQFNVSSCQEINSSGTYTLNANLEGAPNSAACIYIDTSDVVLDCDGHNITNNGTGGTTSAIYVSAGVGPDNNITIRNCPSLSGYTHGAWLLQSNGTTITNCTAHNNTNGFLVQSSDAKNNDLIGNEAFNNTNGILILASTSRNRFTDNDVHDNSQYGFYFDGSVLVPRFNNFSDNRIYNNDYGFYLYNGDDNIFTNNTITNHSSGGFYFVFSSSNSFINNTVHNCSSDGFLQSTLSSSNVFSGNNISECNNGMSLSQSTSSSVDGGIIKGCSVGLSLNQANNTVVTGLHLYNNSIASISASAILSQNHFINLTNVILDNPNGTLTNYTNLSLADVIDANSSYHMSWTGSPVLLPQQMVSFEQMFVNISNKSSTPSYIDSITWHWTQEQANSAGFGAREFSFELWKYNTSNNWTLLNDTPDITGNELSLTSHNPASIYGILATNYQPLNNCTAITEAGTYNLSAHISGAPINATPIPGDACIKINASDVHFDCNGYTISGGYSAEVGIALAGDTGNVLNNITIENCPDIGTFQTGLYARYVENSTFNNITVRDSTFSGVYLWNSDNNTISGSTSYNSGQIGFTASTGSDGNSFIGNTAYNNTQSGFYVDTHSQGNRFIGNTARDSSYGIQVISANNTNITGNHLYNASEAELFIEGASTSTYTIYVDGLIIDNPSAGYVNYTNLSLTDAIAPDTNYTIKWTTNSTTLPPGYATFAGKFVDISNGTSGVSIDDIAWHWKDAESGGTREYALELWKYNALGGWQVMNYSADAGNNTLSLSNLIPASTYAILNDTQPRCGETINTDTTLIRNLRNSTRGEICPEWGLIMGADNITLDCAVYNMTGDGARDKSSALVIVDVDNTTVKNCNIQGFGDAQGASPYYYGTVHIRGAQNTTLDNLTINTTENSVQAIYIYGSGMGALINNSYVRSFSDFAVELYSGGYNLFENSEFIRSSGRTVIALTGSDYNVFENVTATSPNEYVVSLNQYSGNHAIYNLFNNSRFITTSQAFNIESPYNTIENSYVEGQGYYADSGAIKIGGSGDYTTLRNNTINMSRTSCSCSAVFAIAADYVIIEENTIHTAVNSASQGSQSALHLVQCTGANISNNEFTGVPPGFWVSTSVVTPLKTDYNHSFTNNTANGIPAYYFGPEDATTLSNTDNVSQLWIAQDGFVADNITIDNSKSVRVCSFTEDALIKNLTVNETTGSLESFYTEVGVFNLTMRDSTFLDSGAQKTMFYMVRTDNSTFDNINVSTTTNFISGVRLYGDCENNRFYNSDITAQQNALHLSNDPSSRQPRYNLFENDTIRSTGTTSVYLYSGDYNGFTNVSISGNSGVRVQSTALNNTFKDMNITTSSTSFLVADTSSTGTIIEDSYLYLLTGGNFIYTLGSEAPGTIVRNNTLLRGSCDWAAPLKIGGDNSAALYNNITCLSGNAQTLDFVTGSNVNITGNRFMGPTSEKLYVRSAVTSATFQDNYFGSSNSSNSGSYAFSTDAGATTSNITFINNTFVDPSMDLNGFHFDMSDTTFFADDGTTKILYPSLSFNGSSSFLLKGSNFYVLDNITAVDSASAALDQAFNSTANITMYDVNCSDFSINYNSSFVTNPGVMHNSTVVADETFIGGSCNGGVCTNIACSGSTLSFTAPSWSSFMTNNGTAPAPANIPPVLENVTLSSTLGTNLTTENLTAYWDVYDADVDSVYNITNWLLNSSPVNELNMPFERINDSDVNNALDYSGNARHATEAGSPQYLALGGYGGSGVYNYTTGKYVYVDSFPAMSDGTITLWVNFDDSTDTSQGMLGNADLGSGGYLLGFNSASTLSWNIWTGYGWNNADSSVDPLTGQWYHVAATWGSNGMKIYVNGSQKGSNAATLGTSSGQLRIGNYNFAGFDFNGRTDSVQFWDRELSPEQILALYNNQTDLIVSNETTVGDVWQACVTPNDGYQDGATNCSNTLAVLGAPVNVSYDISSCQEISLNGTYTLTSDLTGNLSNGACLKITGDDISIDCDGHSITDDGEAYALWAESADNVTLLNCDISNYSSGVYLYNVSNSAITNVNSSDSTNGFKIERSSNVKVTSSNSKQSTRSGMSISKSSKIRVDPSFYCDSQYGVVVNESNDTLIEDSIACNNTQYGIYVLDSDNTTVLNSRTYNNAQDFQVDNNLGSSVALNISSLVFDRPAGDMSDYTDMSLLDSVSAGGSFSMNWSSGTALPANYTSFENKFVDLTGSESIGTITWTWTAGESAAYNESAFELQKYNGTWNDTGATLNEGANTLTLTSHTPGSIYGIMSNATPLNVTTANVSLYGANVTNVTHHGRFNASAAGNLSTEGGNVSGVNISSTQLTERWAAFYGDVVGNIFLNDVTGTNVYSWSWAPASGGVVCLSTDSALTDPTTVSGALGTDIDIAWSLTSSATDSGNKTFNSTNCTIGIGTETISNASYADTGSAGGFMTCALKSATTPTKPDMLFCSSIISGGTLWNGATGDYEVMVPTPEASGTNETYYFYANLN